MSGGVTGYAAVSAKVRVKYSQLLDQAQFQLLEETSSLESLREALRRTAYLSMLDLAREPDVTVAGLGASLRIRLEAEARSVIQATPWPARRILVQLHRKHELDNLKAILRGVAAKGLDDQSSEMWSRIRSLLFPMSKTDVPAERMIEAGGIAAAIDLMRGTPYYDALSLGLKRYSSEESLFPVEVALDLDYWRRLWQEARKLAGEDQRQAIRVIGSLVDANNLMWAIRYRVFKHLSEEELINYTLPFGHRVRDDDIRLIAAGADLAPILLRLYPEIEAPSTTPETTPGGLPRLELELKRAVMQQCLTAFLGSPFHIGIPLAFLILHDLEVQDLVVLIEAKSSGLSSNEFAQYILRGGEVTV